MLQPAPDHILVEIDPSSYNHVVVEQKSYESSQQGTVLQIGEPSGEVTAHAQFEVGKKVRFKGFKDQEARFKNEETGKFEAYLHYSDVVASEVDDAA